MPFWPSLKIDKLTFGHIVFSCFVSFNLPAEKNGGNIWKTYQVNTYQIARKAACSEWQCLPTMLGKRRWLCASKRGNQGPSPPKRGEMACLKRNMFFFLHFFPLFGSVFESHDFFDLRTPSLWRRKLINKEVATTESLGH